ncbi:DsbA family oxidoreductase [Leisingera aquaemixtae]|uniref:DsbA family protein n=1 Tax=Leisingera aquaemixtae TaxID=1396826 RepID=A0A0P1HL42_9RHOB|nr:DsbA family protein [Leisingera aquaemixtae]UWQ25182.1 DsbA family protein [Leisingera aquaemixtae]UWQ41833.1 DsbA family protein [Leisingera aquaemixtae]UWQ46078.1 DsbA family protein [Leisingera aquaemixtae]CUH99401.1 Protein-disulfide isomerase [Leisingera aquaemixtae]
MKQIHVYSDFVCPYCLLAEPLIRDAAAAEAAEIVWHPFELRPDPVPTLRPEDPYLPAVWQRSVYPLAERLGQKITLPTVSPQPRSALAFEGFAFASDHGRGHEYTLAVFNAFFAEDRDIGDIEVLAALAEAAGLDGAALRQALQDGRYRARHAEALREAEAQQIKAVPTIVIGTTRIEGMPTAEGLRNALQSLAAEEQA